MQTRTILNAYADLNFRNGRDAEGLSARKVRQLCAFRDELLRRMAQRDAWAAEKARGAKPLEWSPWTERAMQHAANMSDEWKNDVMVDESFIRKYLGMDKPA